MKPVQIARLLIRPRCSKTESRGYFLLRLAKENNLSNINKLAIIINQPKSQLGIFTDDALAQYLRGISITALSPPLCNSERAQLVRDKVWLRARICPMCIKEKNPSPIYFDFYLTLRCERHQLLLHNHCIKCGQVLTYSRNHLSHCNCGQALANLDIIHLDTAVDLFETIFAPWRNTKKWYLNESIIHQERLVALALFALLSLMSRKHSTRKRPQPWLWQGEWETVKYIIKRGPISLAEDLISTNINNKEIGVFRKTLKNSKIPFFVSLSDELYKKKKERDAIKYINVIDHIQEPMVSLGKIRNIARLDAEATTKLFYSDYFKIKSITVECKRTNYWISRQEAEKLEQWFESTLTHYEVAEIVGCSSSSVLGLVRIGKLNATYLPTKPRSPRFHRSDVDSFIHAFSSKVTEDLEVNEQVIPLATLPPAGPNCKWWNEAWFALMREILADTIMVYRISAGHGWGHYGIIRSDIIRVSEQARGWRNVLA
ncbi:hypothetical protein [Iodobacter fluviatilis]|uniref:Uncharacterized protein n=1 Tax=Iodobacter fluviatilis TaxID=537 RepID=A0A377SWA6_9NEIS|nr:hypothetical protein [Iodobacter fluviatilis]TCU81621.1 hypothetical protein EV682_12021 [Iodobacter fluviatilis]STR44779.1 Uncharacterised protein [Iodobacter fluviatilis]